MKISIDPYLVVYTDKLIVFYESETAQTMEKPVFKVSMPVDQEILTAYGCESVEEYYNDHIAPLIQEELEFTSLEMIALREFLENNNYFESSLH